MLAIFTKCHRKYQQSWSERGESWKLIDGVRASQEPSRGLDELEQVLAAVAAEVENRQAELHIEERHTEAVRTSIGCTVAFGRIAAALPIRKVAVIASRAADTLVVA